MIELLEHLLLPVLENPMEYRIKEGDSSVFIELQLHPDDEAMLLEEDSKLLFSIRHVLSIASGKKKPSLELVSEFITPEDENVESTEDDETSEEISPDSAAATASEEDTTEE